MIWNFNDIPSVHHSCSINGSLVSGDALACILNLITDPNPLRWFRFEKKDGMIVVTVKEDQCVSAS